VTAARPLPRYGAIESALARGLAPTSYTTTGGTTILARHDPASYRRRGMPSICHIAPCPGNQNARYANNGARPTSHPAPSLPAPHGTFSGGVPVSRKAFQATILVRPPYGHVSPAVIKLGSCAASPQARSATAAKHQMEIEASAPCVSASEGCANARRDETEVGPEEELHERVVRALARVDRLEATQAREKAYAEERAVAKAKAESPTKRPWWRLGT
jgi:hypothetical protein